MRGCFASAGQCAILLTMTLLRLIDLDQCLQALSPETTLDAEIAASIMVGVGQPFCNGLISH